MPNLNQKGFIAQLLLFLILLAGVGVGIYLVQTKTSLFSKAAPVIPNKPETSFELEAQADTSRTYVDVTPLKSVSVGQKFRVDIWVRSDIDPANLFVAKLKFPTDLLQVVEIEKRDANSFINQWIAEPSFDNSSGDISIIGGVNAPGLLTSSQGSGSVKGVGAPPQALIQSPVDSIASGQTVNLQAVLTNGAQFGEIWIAKLPDGKSKFSCPDELMNNGGLWLCKLISGHGQEIEGGARLLAASFTPVEPGEYMVAVSAYSANSNNYTTDPWTECTGNWLSHPPGETPSRWSSCGDLDHLKLTVFSPPVTSTPTVLPTVIPTNTPTQTTLPTSSPQPSQPTLKASRLMVSIIFEAKKTGTANIEFADNAEILRNSDGINILSAQKGLKLEITPITVSQNAVLSLDPPKSTVNRGCSFPVNINLDTAGIQAEGTDAVLSYDPAKFTVQEISKGQIFADYPITDIDSNAGKVAISAISMINAPFEGKGTLATLQFKVKDYAAVGSTTVNFDFDSSNKDKVTDSNVSTVQNGVVTDALGSVTNANYTVGTGICTSQSATLPILECTGITADAQLGKFKEENVYTVKASDRVKVTANVIPLPATVSWQTTVDGKNLTSDPKNGFTFDTGDMDHVSGLYTVYNNTTDSDLVEILEATTKQGSAQATCKRLKFLVQPAGKQISIPVSAKPMQVGETKTFRHDGDINGDSKINLVDMSRLLAQFGETKQSEADLNGDGQINSMDVLSMRNILFKNGVLK